ncbi:MAG TPA: hypothetical protein VFT41_06580, partial [Gemmatimonadaceae bacterium]|nr:hypothetical protein [Gemmatimonadaceae bacterium]
FVTVYLLGGPIAGVIGGAAPILALDAANLVRMVHNRRRVRALVTLPDSGIQVPLRDRHLSWVRIVPDVEHGWAMRLAYSDRPGFIEGVVPVRTERVWRAGMRNTHGMIEAGLTGDAALAAARKILPAINAKGAPKRVVRDAVDVVSGAPDPAELFATQARLHGSPTPITPNGGAPFGALPIAVSLALEMSAHEDIERRAMEGELAMLEAAWKEAEEVAKIADDLLLPVDADQRLAHLRGETPPPG